MKRNIAIFLCCIIFIGLLNGCSGRPRNIRVGIHRAGIEFLEILDKYINESISAEQAHDELMKIRVRVHEFYDRTEEEDELEELMRQIRVIINILITPSDFFPDSVLDSIPDTIFYSRNELAELLNQPLREN